MADLLLTNAHLVAPAAAPERGWLAISNGRIEAIGASTVAPPQSAQVLDLAGLTVLPGVIDPHTHPGNYRMFATDVPMLTQSAARGGVTSLLGIVKSTRLAGEYKPRVEPQDIKPYLEVFDAAREIIRRDSYVDVGLTPIVMGDMHVGEMTKLAELGMTSFKFFPSMAAPTTWHASVGIASQIDDGVVYTGLRKIVDFGGVACFHPENLQVVRALRPEAQATGDTLAAWESASPPALEAYDIRKMAFFSDETRARVYSVHTNSSRGVAEIKTAKEAGVNLVGETCPHYLLLTKDFDGPIPAVAKAGPPLRGDPDREALWEGLRQGIIDVVGSDDPVLDWELKNASAGVWGANPGFGGSGLVLPLLLSEGVNAGRISLRRLVEVCCENPARVFGLYPRKGVIGIGSDADLVVVDLKMTKAVLPRELGYEFSPYEGRQVTGWPVMSFLRGRPLLSGQTVNNVRGDYLAREASGDPG
jgi:dihydropyrimidinase